MAYVCITFVVGIDGQLSWAFCSLYSFHWCLFLINSFNYNDCSTSSMKLGSYFFAWFPEWYHGLMIDKVNCCRKLTVLFQLFCNILPCVLLCSDCLKTQILSSIVNAIAHLLRHSSNSPMSFQLATIFTAWKWICLIDIANITRHVLTCIRIWINVYKYL